MFENIDKHEYNTFNELDNLLFKTRSYLDFDLIQKHFGYNNLEGMLESLNNTKNTYKNGVKLTLIRSGLRDLKNEIRKMSKNEIKSERPDVIVNLVERILAFKNQNQEGQGLKILTPQQMLTRLTISLAQLEAGNSLEKPKHEMRWLLYSLYRSKHYPKQSINI